MGVKYSTPPNSPMCSPVNQCSGVFGWSLFRFRSLVKCVPRALSGFFRCFAVANRPQPKPAVKSRLLYRFDRAINSPAMRLWPNADCAPIEISGCVFVSCDNRSFMSTPG